MNHVRRQNERGVWAIWRHLLPFLLRKGLKYLLLERKDIFIIPLALTSAYIMLRATSHLAAD